MQTAIGVVEGKVVSLEEPGRLRDAKEEIGAYPDVKIHTYQFVGPAFYAVRVEFLKRHLWF